MTSEQVLGKIKANAEPLSLWQRIWGGRPDSGKIEFSRSYINSPHSSPRLYNSSLDAIQAKPVELGNEIARKAREGKNADPAYWKHPVGSTPVDRPFDTVMAREGIIGRDTSLFDAIKARKLSKNPLGTVEAIRPKAPIVKNLPKMINPWIKRIGNILKKAR